MVAVVPAPPLLVPQLCAGAAAESDVMREACLSVAHRLASARRWIVLGSDPGGRRRIERPGRGTFLGFGVDVRVGFEPAPVTEGVSDLPLPVLIAGWLRDNAAPAVSVRAELVAPDLPTRDCRRLGAELAAEPTGEGAGGTAVLVVGDGATTHTEKAPGHLDERAGPFDAQVAAALATADSAGLLALDAELGVELNSAGRAPWQVLAGLVLARGELARGELAAGRWHGELTYSDFPYGVGYHVAWWQRRDEDR